MIRIAEQSDLPSIVAIYNEAIAARCTGETSPVTVQERLPWFAEHTPQQCPIMVDVEKGELRGWCSLSPYRKGRMALRYTEEVSYFVATRFHRRGVGLALVQQAKVLARSLGIKTLFAIVLEHNFASQQLLERAGFARWGFLPDVADFDGTEVGQYYYGLRLAPPNKAT
jgi:L-amino acid N-acyltransferase YncA